MSLTFLIAVVFTLGNESKQSSLESRDEDTTPIADEMKNRSKGTEPGESIARSNSNNSISPTSSSLDSSQTPDVMMLDNEVKKPKKKKGSKRKKKPDEMLQCIICGRTGLSSEFCASGRFCSQRCVGAYASKCRADTLAAAAAGGEVLEQKKRRRHKKDGGKKGGKGMKRKNYLFEKEFHGISSPMLPLIGPEDVKNKKAKLSLTDDAHFFYSA
ncbi:uncharacterized protein LOC135694926, partial [Rhopilema esculentum]|uniref:uncharacterized protein LOC135694926 n=1 Tax=Rhopilema esculentum TaxID=499914 RepID=UPI0031D84E6F